MATKGQRLQQYHFKGNSGVLWYSTAGHLPSQTVSGERDSLKWLSVACPFPSLAIIFFVLRGGLVVTFSKMANSKVLKKRVCHTHLSLRLLLHVFGVSNALLFKTWRILRVQNYFTMNGLTSLLISQIRESRSASLTRWKSLNTAMLLRGQELVSRDVTNSGSLIGQRLI